jgi:hypothetical protein
MLIGGVGVSEVQTSDLKNMLNFLHRGELKCPINVAELARCGLQHTAEPLLRHLHGLDERAVLSVLVAVLAERAAFERSVLKKAEADALAAKWAAQDAADAADAEE